MDVHESAMNQEQKKRAAAIAALECVEIDTIVGVGTGSTADHFIEALTTIKHKIEGAIASSKLTAERLKSYHIPLYELNWMDTVALYVDGADEVSDDLQLSKGSADAFTQAKVIAANTQRFVCLADDSERVEALGCVPVALEVIPMARNYVAQHITEMGGHPIWREGFVTDNANIVIDVHNLDLSEPAARESEFNEITGVVANGLFARRPADLLLLGTEDGILTHEKT